MAARSTNSEYQPAPPSSRLRGKSAFARTANPVGRNGDDAIDVEKKSWGGGTPLASGNRVPMGSRGVMK